MPGPLPSASPRRRNAATIGTTVLPAEGRTGRAPAVPKAYRLKAAGRAWWNWAWKLPQAAAWDEGARYFVVRRAQLEDELASLDFANFASLRDLLAGAESEAIQRVEEAIELLKRLASGSTSLMKEMREIDNRLGLNPKAMAELRWSIAPPAEQQDLPASGVSSIDDYRSRLG
ncbi:hypothetical protein [Patulibacter sp. SYSU D01012]|uniref:phage terminase small subunit n=1 Tax=Patulibacter sp. SYSU D01012 TaxID=2817381 RepID=UPI001B318204|nr:hypothetical protein [Patulibacter sp. SYSU D01012]